MARVVGPRHPITLSLTPLGLDLALGALTVEAVSAGPVWQGTHAILTDGSVKLQGPTIDVVAPVTFVAQFSRATAANSHVMWVGGVVTGSYSLGTGTATALVHQVTGARTATATGTSTGDHTFFGGWPATGNHTAGRDGDALVSSGFAVAAPGAGVPLWGIGSSLGSAAAGLKLRSLSIYARELSDVVRAAMPAGTSPLTADADAVHCYDMSNFYDSGGGVWKVRDLIDTSGASDLTVVSGDNTDFVAV